jgi:hypothetical protein
MKAFPKLTEVRIRAVVPGGKLDASRSPSMEPIVNCRPMKPVLSKVKVVPNGATEVVLSVPGDEENGVVVT